MKRTRRSALSTVSYMTLHRLWGPMELNAVMRIINQGVYETWGMRFGA